MNPTLVDEFKEYATKGINDQGNFKHTVYQFSDTSGVSVIYGKGSYGLEAIKIYFNLKGYAVIGEPTGYLDEQGLAEYLRDAKEGVA